MEFYEIACGFGYASETDIQNCKESLKVKAIENEKETKIMKENNNNVNNNNSNNNDNNNKKNNGNNKNSSVETKLNLEELGISFSSEAEKQAFIKSQSDSYSQVSLKGTGLDKVISMLPAFDNAVNSDKDAGSKKADMDKVLEEQRKILEKFEISNSSNKNNDPKTSNSVTNLSSDQYLEQQRRIYQAIERARAKK